MAFQWLNKEFVWSDGNVDARRIPKENERDCVRGRGTGGWDWEWDWGGVGGPHSLVMK